jgi:Ca2+-binding EF-hand superfamily protein
VITHLQDGNGFISRQELGYVIENIGIVMSKEEVEVVPGNLC